MEGVTISGAIKWGNGKNGKEEFVRLQNQNDKNYQIDKYIGQLFINITVISYRYKLLFRLVKARILHA